VTGSPNYCLKNSLRVGDPCVMSSQCLSNNCSGICVAAPCTIAPGTQCYATASCCPGWSCAGLNLPTPGNCTPPPTPTLVADGSACDPSTGKVCTAASSCVRGICVGAYTSDVGAPCLMPNLLSPTYSVCKDDLVCFNTSSTSATTGTCTRPTLCGQISGKSNPPCNPETSQCGCSGSNVACTIVYNPCNSQRKAFVDCYATSGCTDLSGGILGKAIFFGSPSFCGWKNCRQQMIDMECCRLCGGSSLNQNTHSGLSCGSPNTYTAPKPVCGGCPVNTGSCPQSGGGLSIMYIGIIAGGAALFLIIVIVIIVCCRRSPAAPGSGDYSYRQM